MIAMIPSALDIPRTLSILGSSHVVPGKRKLGFSIDDIVGDDKNSPTNANVCKIGEDGLPSETRLSPPPPAGHQLSHRSCPPAQSSSAPPRIPTPNAPPSSQSTPLTPTSQPPSSLSSSSSIKHSSPSSVTSDHNVMTSANLSCLNGNKNGSIGSPIETSSPLPYNHQPLHSHPRLIQETNLRQQSVPPHPHHPHHHPGQSGLHPSQMHPSLSSHHPHHQLDPSKVHHQASLPCNQPEAAFAAALSSPYFALGSRSFPIEYRSPYHHWLLARHSPIALQAPFPGSPIAPFMFFNRKPKRVRTAFSPSQLMELERAFDKNNYVIGNERKELAKKLGLNETQVKVWFQNRRTKQKRQKQEEDDGTYQVSNSDNRGETDDNSECMSDADDEDDAEMFNGSADRYHHNSSPKTVNQSQPPHR